jgi:hypothetical protein
MICILCGNKDFEPDKYFYKPNVNIRTCCLNDGLMVPIEGTRRPLGVDTLIRIWESVPDKYIKYNPQHKNNGNNKYVTFTEYRYKFDKTQGMNGKWVKELRAELNLTKLKDGMSQSQVRQISDNIREFREQYPYAYGSDIIKLALKQHFDML